MAAVCYLGFSITWFWAIVRLGLCFSLIAPYLAQKCWSTPKLWTKIEIQDGCRPPYWIFENLIFEHWDPLDCRLSITVPYKPWLLHRRINVFSLLAACMVSLSVWLSTKLLKIKKFWIIKKLLGLISIRTKKNKLDFGNNMHSHIIIIILYYAIRQQKT